MNIFLCWSGPASEAIAVALQVFLGDTIQALKVFLSSESIGKGSRWRDALGKQLYECNFGILCLTKDCLDSRWILFEAGALSKNISDGRVTALLAGIKPADVLEPLSQFQHTGIGRDELLKLLQDINALLSDDAQLDADRLQRVFDLSWPTLNGSIDAALKLTTAEPAPRDTDSMIAEILETVRDIKRDTELKLGVGPSIAYIGNSQTVPLSSLIGNGAIVAGPTNIPASENPVKLASTGPNPPSQLRVT